MAINIIEHNHYNSLVYSFKTITANDINLLSINISTLFSLTKPASGVERLNNKDLLEQIIDNTMEKEVFWDTGIPKGVGEFLVYGAAFAAKPVRSLGVSVSVGDISKILLVSGDRKWGPHGICEPLAFTVMPITYANSFGGSAYPLNPIGKGYIDGSDIDAVLPNIESIDQLIVTKADTPAVAGFEPYPLNSLQRKLDGYSASDFINQSVIPNNILPEYFNTAPFDQRLDTFFEGNEKIQIRNMHPLLPIINSSLPSLRFRLFVLRKNEIGEEVFHEIGVRIETLWLLPNLESGILTCRATCTMDGLDKDNTMCLYSVLESIDDEAKPQDYYLQQLLLKINNNDMKSQDSEMNTRDDMVEKNIDQSGLEPDKSSTEQAGISDEELQLADEMLANLQNLMRQFNLTAEDLDQYAANRRNEGLPLYPEYTKIIEQLHNYGVDNPDLEEKLHNLMQILEESQKELEQSSN